MSQPLVRVGAQRLQVAGAPNRATQALRAIQLEPQARALKRPDDVHLEESRMITPLQKHRGQNGAIVALFVLVAAIAVVVLTQPRAPAPEPEAVAQAPKPAASTLTKAALPEVKTIATRPDEPLATLAVGELDFRRRVKATGTVGFDEKLTAHVRVPVSGWLVDVKPTAAKVKRGTRFANLYSPAIVAAELELVQQVRDFRSQAELDEVRRKLLRWGMPIETIRRVEQTGQPQGKLPVWAWRDGTIVAKQAVPGLFVEPAVELYTITNPARAWIMADVPDADAERLRVGMPAKVTIKGRAKPVTANVGYIFKRSYGGEKPVRFELAGTFPRDAAAAVEVTLELERGLAVPESAVLRASSGSLVYVVKGGTADAREVKLGTHAGGFYRVEHGLAAGETVALDAQRLVDSALRAR